MSKRILHLPNEEKKFYESDEEKEANLNSDVTDEEMVDFLNKIGIEARIIYLN